MTGSISHGFHADVSAEAKLERLRERLRSLGSAVVAFSSGVDSTFLLRVAEIAAAFKGFGFAYVTLDLQGYRTGSMNETLGHET